MAAFLLNVVITRLIYLEREQIATLKAFGYSNLEVGWHYSKLVVMMTSIGLLFGIILGIWFGRGLSHIYTQFYSLPFLEFRLETWVIVIAAVVSIGVSLLGTFWAVYKAVKLSPAEGMRPEAPAIYRRTLLEKIGLQNRLTQSGRMILRHIQREPLKSFLTTLGLSMATGIMMVGTFQEGAINYMVQVHYHLSHREDITVNFTEPTSARSLSTLRGLAGVEYVEGIRSAGVKLIHRHHQYQTSIQGMSADTQLQLLLDKQLRPVKVPPSGMILTQYLADLLHLKVGDYVTVEVMERNRPIIEVQVVATIKEYLGVNAYIDRRYLNRLLQEGDVLSSALMKIDQEQKSRILQELKDMPRVASILEQKASIQAFYKVMNENILFFSFITTLLGASIAFGVVYNSMRIAFSERYRELASLRVLGFTHVEVGWVLFGELALLTFISIPLGLMIGYGLCGYLASQYESDLYRVPLVLAKEDYSFAVIVVVTASLVSMMMIWQKVVRLDMVAVLKTRE